MAKRKGSSNTPHPRNKNPKFTGALNQPIRVRFFAPTITFRKKEEAEKRNALEMIKASTEQMKKLPLLSDYFDIPRKQDGLVNYELLACALAMTFVPGFQLVDADTQGRGRPKGRDPNNLMHLLADVESIKRDKRYEDATSDAKVLKLLV